MVFRRKSGAMTKAPQGQVQQRNPSKAEMKKFEESDDDEDDDEDLSDDDVDAGSEQEEMKSENDDDDDDDGDDDEDDDDDDEGEGKNVAKMNQQKQKQKPGQQKGSLLKIAPTPIQKNLSTPGKKNQMAESAQNKRKSTDTAPLPSSKRPRWDVLADDEFAIEKKRQTERDKRSLFVAQIPVSVTEEDLRALSDDIIDVRIPIKRRAQQMQPFAFVEFLNEAKAEENYTKFGNMKLKGQKFVVDFVGEKSKNQQRNKSDNLKKKTVNRRKLFVSGIQADSQLADVTKLFPTAKTISLEPHKEGPKKFAYVLFSSDEETKLVFTKSENLKLNGRPLTVLYAAEHGKGKKLKNKKKGKKQKKPQAKAQKAAKEEVDSDEGAEDDEDDDDDDDGDDDDGDDDDDD